MLETLYESSLKSLPLLVRGKVRDVYGVGDEYLLIVTTDRLSAFDVILRGVHCQDVTVLYYDISHVILKSVILIELN